MRTWKLKSPRGANTYLLHLTRDDIIDVDDEGILSCIDNLSECVGCVKDGSMLERIKCHPNMQKKGIYTWFLNTWWNNVFPLCIFKRILIYWHSLTITHIWRCRRNNDVVERRLCANEEGELQNRVKKNILYRFLLTTGVISVSYTHLTLPTNREV